MQKEKTLVIMAAGIGARFKDGVKQLKSVGPSGECIMEYSVFTAIEAGFNKVIFIIRRDLEDLFNEIIGTRVCRICAAKGAQVLYAYQEQDHLPDGYICPPERKKPWGTGHALLSCKGMIDGGFLVINADDYYGHVCYKQMADFLDSLPDDSKDTYALSGFLLRNTLSEYGGVTRGLCSADENGMLTHIRETKNIIKTPMGGGIQKGDDMEYFDGDMPVSMNMWAFTPDVLDRLELQFSDYLKDGGLTAHDAEFLIPTEVGAMLDRGVTVRVIPTPDRWFGMTYAEDTAIVRDTLSQMIREGVYTSPLF